MSSYPSNPAAVRDAGDRIVGRLIGAGVLLVALAGCGGGGTHATLPAEIDPLVHDIDSTMSPGTDFAAYANGAWYKANPIPPSERGWGIGNLVYEETYRQRREICEQAAAANAAAGTSAQKVGDFWTTGMDSAAVEAQGAAPMKPYLDEVAAIGDRDALVRTIAHFNRLGFAPLYTFAIQLDERNSANWLVHLYQGGLGLPDRDYYFGADPSTKHIRDEYLRHLAAMFGLAGDDAATARRSAADVMAIETALARASRTLEQRRDPWANYHKVSFAGQSAANPSLQWSAAFAALGAPAQDTLIVAQPEFYATADSLVRVTPLPAWKSYLRWTVLNGMANRLSMPFENQDFHFYGTVLSGTPEMRPRWKRVIDATENGIGELLGQEWVKKYCSPATKARYEKLTQDIFDAYRERIRALPWMSDVTKQRALAKLDKVGRKVAYPDKWRDYSALEIQKDSWAANQLRINEWWFQHSLDKLGKPVDRTEWDMTPQTYNAYYDGSKVEIVLPAAMFMIPGVPDSLVDDAVLYSYAGGSTIGHEITHGFDDEGRQSDENGNLNPWWTAEDSVQFTARAKKLAEQFDEYMVGDKHVRGQATLGENMADLGGVVLGLQAFKKTPQYKAGRPLNGLTPTQRYFLGYALSWLGQRRPEALAQQIMTDVHAPAYLRINGPVANVPEWYDAFGVKPGDPMYRPDSVRVAIW